MCRCLYCYKPLAEGERDYHAACARKFFWSRVAPTLDYSSTEMEELARQVIQTHTTLTGVQAKLSLSLTSNAHTTHLTIVGLWGAYIFKPQSESYAALPENEDLTMHLAEVAHIPVVPHSLIRLKDGTLGYITRRIDRTPEGEKIAMEDMCQLTERPTEYKYKSSYEQIAKTIRRYSSVPQMDVINFWELVLFAWLTGNNDMHLKNFSLYEPKAGAICLAPAYDLLCVAIANPVDDEELALTLSGRKKHLKKRDFEQAFETCGIDIKILEKLCKKYLKLWPKMCEVIDNSFLSDEQKAAYKSVVEERMGRLVR